MPEELWNSLNVGHDPVDTIPTGRWTSQAVKNNIATDQGGFIDDIEYFDAGFFDISPSEALELDPQQRLLLEVSHEAFENAGIRVKDLMGSKTGVYIGISASEYMAVGKQLGHEIGPFSAFGSAMSTAAGRISYCFGLEGPALAIDSACASSLAAVLQAASALNNHECDLALAGGVSLILTPDGYISFSALNMISPSGRCRSFSADADGYVPSEGCGAIVLKRLDDAVKDNDPILAVLKGGALNNGGRSEYSPGGAPQAQVDVIRQALSVSNLNYDDIDFLETHGSGSPQGDIQEGAVLNDVFSQRHSPLLIGSVKSNLGNMEAAAGMASIMKVILCIRHQQLVPNLHFSTPADKIDWNMTPLQVVREARDWPVTGRPKTAGISGRGINGTNAHLILQEWTGSRPRQAIAPSPPYLVTLAAKSISGLENTLRSFTANLPTTDSALAAWCEATNFQRSAYPVRFASLVSNVEQLHRDFTRLNSLTLEARQNHYQTSACSPQIFFHFSFQPTAPAAESKALYDSYSDYRDAFKYVISGLSVIRHMTFSELYSVVSKVTTPENLLSLAAFSLCHQFSLASLLQTKGLALDYLTDEKQPLFKKERSNTDDVIFRTLRDEFIQLLSLSVKNGPAEQELGAGAEMKLKASDRPAIVLSSELNKTFDVDKKSLSQITVIALLPLLNNLTELWSLLFMAGVNIDWQLYHGNKSDKVLLPTTAFARSHIWFDKSKASTDSKSIAKEHQYPLCYTGQRPAAGEMKGWCHVTFRTPKEFDAQKSSLLITALTIRYPQYQLSDSDNAVNSLNWWMDYDVAEEKLLLAVNPSFGDESTLITLFQTFHALYTGKSLPQTDKWIDIDEITLYPLQLTREPSLRSSDNQGFASVGVPLQAEWNAKIHNFCQQQGVTKEDFFSGCFIAFLGRTLDQYDFSIAISAFQADNLSFEPGTVGIKNIHIASSQPFIEWVRENITRAKIMPLLRNKTALFGPDGEKCLPQFCIRTSFPELSPDFPVVGYLPASPEHDLAFELILSETTLACRLHYSCATFNKKTITDWSEWLAALITNAVTEPNIPVRKLELLTSQSRDFILYNLNDTARSYPLDCPVDQLVDYSSSRTAIICQDRQLTYYQLGQEVNTLAQILVENGARPGKPVGVMLTRSSYLIISLLAAIKIGAPYVPLDPAYPADRVELMIKISQTDILLSDRPLDEHTEYTGLVIDPVVAIKAAARRPATAVQYDFASDTLAYIIFTSGSTGLPKGVMVEQKNVVNFIFAMRESLPLPANPTVLGLTSVSFDIFVLELFLTLASEGTLVLAAEEQQTNPYEIAALLQQYSVELAQMTPSRLQLLAASELNLNSLFSTLKLLLVGGEAFPLSLLENLKDIKTLRIFNMYGPTETTVWSAVKEMTEATAVTLGSPVANTQLYLLDQHLTPVPRGMCGDLYISGEGLARGYFNDQQRTQQVYIDNPFIAGRKMYRSGDLAAWNDRYELEYFGRSDNQIKLRGYRIELQEIENTLQDYPALTGVAVILRTSGDGSPIIAAFYTAQEKLCAEQLHSWLGKKLPAPMLPGVWIQLDKFPLTPNSKIDRKQLPENIQPWLAVPPGDAMVTPAENEPALMQALRSVWQSVLGDIPLTEESNFFNVGGTSISMVLLHSRVQKHLNRVIDINDFFTQPTLAGNYHCILKQGDELLL